MTGATFFFGAGRAFDDGREVVDVQVGGGDILVLGDVPAGQDARRDVDQGGHQSALQGAPDIGQVGTVGHLDDHAFVGFGDHAVIQQVQ